MTESLPFDLFRYGVGVGGAITVALVGTLYFEPPIRYALYGIAGLDFLLTPYVLGKAMNADETTPP